MSDNGKVWTFHISVSPERCISFPTVGDTDPKSPHRELTEAENVAFESICNLLMVAINQFPAGQEKLEVVIPKDLGPFSAALVTHIFNWLKLNNWKPLVFDDYFRRLSALRI